MAHVHTHFNGIAASGNAAPAISVRNLRMGYGTRVLLDDASFDVRARRDPGDPRRLGLAASRA